MKYKKLGTEGKTFKEETLINHEIQEIRYIQKEKKFKKRNTHQP